MRKGDSRDDRYTTLLKIASGYRAQMPFGYFSKAGVRIRFFDF